MKELTDQEKIERASFKDKKDWLYLKQYLEKKIHHYKDINHIRNDKENPNNIYNVYVNFRENYLYQRIFCNIIELVEKAWPRDADEIIKKGEKNGK